MLATIPQGLTQQEAQIRAKQIKQVEYHLHFHFRENYSYFDGETRIFFRSESLEHLFLDATDLEINRLFIDGNEIENILLENRRIKLPRHYFQTATELHEIQISYKGFYHSNQVGLFLFRDHETQQEYIFSHLEPYGANKVFPCFDQPDIPGIFSVEIVFPKEWQAVTNTYFQEEPGTEEEPEQYWRSQKSLPFSTYLFALAVGPFKVIQHKEYPHIRLYLRPNRVENPNNFFDETFLFETAAHNLAFFEKVFDTPHPYGKLDLVGVPTYVNGGMENVGAIFLCEPNMVNSEAPSRFQRYNQFLLISHEISHLWFGDLVTMAWWDDLWLKESFATFMAYEAAKEISHFAEEVWVYFHEKAKRDSFKLDTHSRIKPVTRDVPDAETADWSFDGICYRKGASLLRQLKLYLGEDVFWDGIRRFFKQHAYQAVQFQDLLACFSQNENTLETYMSQWVKRSGHPKIKVQQDETRFQLIQEDSLGQEKFWTVPLEIHLYQTNGLVSTQHVLLEEKEQSFSYPNGAKVAYLFPNGQDYSFVRSLLSKKAILKILDSSVEYEPIQRMQFISILWDGVIHGELSFQEFVEAIEKRLSQENVALIYNTGIEKLIYGVHRYLSKERQLLLKKRLQQWGLQEIEKGCFPKDSNIALIDLFIFTVETPEDVTLFSEIETNFSLSPSRKQRYYLSMQEVLKGWKTVADIKTQDWLTRDPEFAWEHTFFLEAVASKDKEASLENLLQNRVAIGSMPGYLEALFFSAQDEQKKTLLEQLLPHFPTLAERMRFWSFTPIVTKSISNQTLESASGIIRDFMQTHLLSAPLQDLLQGALEDLEEDFRVRKLQ